MDPDVYINIEYVTRAQNILPEGKQGLTILGSCLYIKKIIRELRTCRYIWESDDCRKITAVRLLLFRNRKTALTGSRFDI